MTDMFSELLAYHAVFHNYVVGFLALLGILMINRRWNNEKRMAKASEESTQAAKHAEHWSRFQKLLDELTKTGVETPAGIVEPKGDETRRAAIDRGTDQSETSADSQGPKKAGIVHEIEILARGMMNGSEDHFALLERVCAIIREHDLSTAGSSPGSVNGSSDSASTDVGLDRETLSDLVGVVAKRLPTHSTGNDADTEISGLHNQIGRSFIYVKHLFKRTAPERTFRALLEEVNLTECELSERDLRDSVLAKARLRGSNLRGSRLNRANLRSAEMQGCNLRLASLRNANLHGADLKGADCSGARMEGAILRHAIFGSVERANKEGSAILRRAILSNSNLVDAKFAGCDLEKAQLRNAVLVDTNFDDSKLEGAIWDDDNMVLADIWDFDKKTNAYTIKRRCRRMDDARRVGLERCRARLERAFSQPSEIHVGAWKRADASHKVGNQATSAEWKVGP